MSRVSPYGSIEKRTFESALMHLLETEYGLLGGRRILHLLTDDILALEKEFHPALDHTQSGCSVWTCTADEGKKAEPGKPTEAYKTVTVQLPFVVAEDVQERTNHKTPRGQRYALAQARDKRRLARMVHAAQAQGGLLTLAELSVILNKSYQVISQYVREWEQETGEVLPLKGYKMDQGSRPTHKKEIVRWSEKGLEPPDIARETGHNLKSVERYLKDYERVKLLLKRGVVVDEISSMIGRGKQVVLEYVKLVHEYHPELFADAT
jgi:transposase